MTKGKNNRRRRKVTAFLLALCMVWLMLPPGEARAATPQPEAEVQQTFGIKITILTQDLA